MNIDIFIQDSNQYDENDNAYTIFFGASTAAELQRYMSSLPQSEQWKAELYLERLPEPSGE